MSSIIRDFCSLSTVLIKNEWEGKGTAFLVGDKNKKRIFIVTNKHVISENEKIRHNFKRVTFCFNREREDGVIFAEKVEAELDSDEHDVWREHPDKDVDVMAFDITQLLLELPLLKMKVILDDYLAIPEIFDRLDIKIADEIIVLGYPDMFGLEHQNSNFPIIRQGIVASCIGEKLED